MKFARGPLLCFCGDKAEEQSGYSKSGLGPQAKKLLPVIRGLQQGLMKLAYALWQFSARLIVEMGGLILQKKENTTRLDHLDQPNPITSFLILLNNVVRWPAFFDEANERKQSNNEDRIFVGDDE